MKRKRAVSVTAIDKIGFSYLSVQMGCSDSALKKILHIGPCVDTLWQILLRLLKQICIFCSLPLLYVL